MARRQLTACFTTFSEDLLRFRIPIRRNVRAIVDNVGFSLYLSSDFVRQPPHLLVQSSNVQRPSLLILSCEVVELGPSP